MEAVNLTQVPVVDNHCHGVKRDQTFEELTNWRRAFTESVGLVWCGIVASTAFYRRLIRTLADFLDCEPEEEAVFQARSERDGRELTAALLRAANVDTLLDTGFRRPEERCRCLSWESSQAAARSRAEARDPDGGPARGDSLTELRDSTHHRVGRRTGPGLRALKRHRRLQDWSGGQGGRGRMPKSPSASTGGPPKQAPRAWSTSPARHACCTSLSRRRRGRRFPSSSTSATATPTRTSCSATLSTCAPC